MSKIKVLPENLCNRIAAGEVIERPASVVKELTENAIDAGATSIKIEIEQCGVKLIRVTDDGFGMDEDDALLCLEPHATSKISTEQDIHNITSLGFRGEALPSIASVSRFRLKTRTRDRLEGTEVAVDGGRALRAVPTGCAPGTEITVRDLFFNTPARKKFLKSDVTEERHIQETVYMLALPYPGVAFSLHIDGKEIFNSPADSSPLPRMACFFGKNFTAGLLSVAYAADDCKINGFIAAHGVVRPSRREQRFFVNGRAVEAPALYNGIRDGYSNLVERGKYPPAVLFVTIPADAVDVNVHPAKREVRFRQERKLTVDVATAVRAALRQASSPQPIPVPGASLASVIESLNIRYERETEEVPELELYTNPEMSPQFEREATGFPSGVLRPRLGERTLPARPEQSHALPEGRLELPGSGEIRVIGFLQQTYILAEDHLGMLIIDQHAAHERVLFEKLLKGVSEDNPAQKLLLPVTIELSKSDAAFAAKTREVFRDAGFELEMISGNTIMLCSIPAALRQENLQGIIIEIIAEMTGNGSGVKNKMEALAGAACKAAVKANDQLTMLEAEQLIRQMARCELPFSCPHGRPTIINISLNELEKRFGRK